MMNNFFSSILFFYGMGRRRMEEKEIAKNAIENFCIEFSENDTNMNTSMLYDLPSTPLAIF